MIEFQIYRQGVECWHVIRIDKTADDIFEYETVGCVFREADAYRIALASWRISGYAWEAQTAISFGTSRGALKYLIDSLRVKQ